MKTRNIIFTLLFFIPPIAAQSIVINSGASIYVPAGADICAGTYGNITGNIYGVGTQCGQLPVPVELQSFTVVTKNNIVLLNWETATEVNNYRFDIERKVSVKDWEKIGFVEGHGNSNSTKSYLFADNNPVGGNKFKYRLKQIDADGEYDYSNEIEIEMIPTKFELFQNYPNPFNPKTVIKYQLLKESKIVIKIYNILGAEVLELLNDTKEPGIYEAEFNADDLSSGTYIYRISAGNFVETKKMILLK